MDSLSKDEFLAAVKKLKNKKAASINGIPSKAWKYSGERIRQCLFRIIQEIWNGKGIPEDWKTSVIVSLY